MESPTGVKVGVRLPHLGPCAAPGLIQEFSATAERLGFDSLWTSDHLAFPRHSRSLHRGAVHEDDWYAERTPWFECLTTLAYAAGATSRIQLGTMVEVLPIRNPVLNARQLATIDALSGGRLLLGGGTGWMEEEAEALGMPWNERGARMEEHVALLRTLWTSQERYTSFHGRFYSFDEIDPRPHPAQNPPPILIGGYTPVAWRRAGRIGDGWIGAGLPADKQAHAVAAVQRAASAAGRDPSSLIFVGAMQTRSDATGSPVALDTLFTLIDEFHQGGTSHIILMHDGVRPEHQLRWLSNLATTVLPNARKLARPVVA